MPCGCYFQHYPTVQFLKPVALLRPSVWIKEHGSQAQTRRLIRFRADNEPRFLKSKASAKQQWQALISELELEGKVSSQQVSKKWENLKKRYKELKTGKSGAGTDAGEVTATNWQYYEDMHEVLGARPCMDPPLLVDAGAEEEDIPTTMDTVEPTPSPSPSSSSSPPPPKRRKSDPFMDFLEKENSTEGFNNPEAKQGSHHWRDRLGAVGSAHLPSGSLQQQHTEYNMQHGLALFRVVGGDLWLGY
ncbi:hypothetical protein PAMA_011181 [Pampus argenteus]